jgi:hypothetical protein
MLFLISWISFISLVSCEKTSAHFDRLEHICQLPTDRKEYRDVEYAEILAQSMKLNSNNRTCGITVHTLESTLFRIHNFYVKGKGSYSKCEMAIELKSGGSMLHRWNINATHRSRSSIKYEAQLEEHNIYQILLNFWSEEQCEYSITLGLTKLFNCSSRIGPEFRCTLSPGNLCINALLKCNSFADCPKEEDEKNCGKSGTTESNKWKTIIPILLILLAAILTLFVMIIIMICLHRAHQIDEFRMTNRTVMRPNDSGNTFDTESFDMQSPPLYTESLKDMDKQKRTFFLSRKGKENSASQSPSPFDAERPPNYFDEASSISVVPQFYSSFIQPPSTPSISARFKNFVHILSPQKRVIKEENRESS